MSMSKIISSIPKGLCINIISLPIYERHRRIVEVTKENKIISYMDIDWKKNDILYIDDLHICENICWNTWNKNYFHSILIDTCNRDGLKSIKQFHMPSKSYKDFVNMF